jgi:amino acid transporter
VDLIGGFAHLRFDTWFKWLSTVITIAAIIVFCMQYGKQMTTGVTFGKVFGYGFKIALVISILMVLYSFLSFYVIFPELTDQILVKTRTDLEAKGGLSEEQIDQAVNMTKKFMQPIPIAIFAFLATLFFGTIGALLGAAFTKKSEPGVFSENP